MPVKSFPLKYKALMVGTSKMLAGNVPVNRACEKSANSRAAKGSKASRIVPESDVPPTERIARNQKSAW